MKFHRYIFRNFQDQLITGKAYLILGPRRSGKSVLLQDIKRDLFPESILLNGEDPNVSNLLLQSSIGQIRQLLGTKKLLMIDEAQKIQGIGNIVKLMLDEIGNLSVILTGSSAFDLQNRFGEPLTGRKKTYYLYPMSQLEFSATESILETNEMLEERMVFGGYPEVWQYPDRISRIEYLNELANDYLYKDVLILDNIRNAGKLQALLRLLAFQIGKEVSNDELGRQIQMSRNTVDKYLDLLSKVFVIFKISGFSRNLRKEVTKNSRWYFYDNGILNTLLTNFTPLVNRSDVGSLWENYLISERLKSQSYQHQYSQNYFWRTYDRQEIDWVEDINGQLTGYEIKWQEKKMSPPSAWRKAYPGAEYKVIHRQNYLDWLCVQAVQETV